MAINKTARRLEWNISEFYKRSWNLLKENKKILIFGVAVTMFAGGSSNNYRSNSSSSRDTDTTNVEVSQELSGTEQYAAFLKEKQTEKTNIEDVEYQLSGTDDSPKEFDPVSSLENLETPLTTLWEDVFLKGFKEVNIGIYVLLVFQMLFAMTVIMVFAIAASSWSQAALIKAISEADTKKTWKIFTVAKSVWPRVSSLVWISIVPWLLFYLVIIGGVLLFVMGAAVLENSVIGPIYNIVVGVVGAFSLLYFTFRILYTQVFAKRYSVLDDLSGKDSWKQAWILSNGNLMKMVRLSVLNSLVAIGVTIVLAIPFVIGAVLIATLYTDLTFASVIAGQANASIAAITFSSGLLFVFAIIIYSIYSVIWQSFTFGVHHYAFLSLRNTIEEVSTDA